MDDRDVDRLVARAARGEAEAFEMLYEAFSDRVYSFALSRLRDHHDAEEVTVSVFLRAWKGLAAYDQRGLPFGAWLFRIARNAVIDEVRRKARAPVTAEMAEAEALPARESTDEEALRRADSEVVRGCVSRLGDEQAEVIVLRFFWGFDIASTAEALGKSAGAIKALQHRAVRNLAGMLAEREVGRDRD